MTRFLLGVPFAQMLAGCGSGDGARPGSAESSAPLSPVPSPDEHGRFIGAVTIGDVDYFGDAILTIDGEIRLYVGDPYADSGALQIAKPESSAQFVGALDMQGRGSAGSGFIVGQECAAASQARFCDETLSAEIRVARSSGWLDGEIRVATNQGEELWQLALRQWNNYYDLPGRLAHVAGLYNELLAEFAGNGAMVVRVDEIGRLFFQSAHSGCIGNGTLAPHLDGKFNVYDVSLNIEGCDAIHAFMNGDFEGLASESASSVWDYDSVLRIWLSTRDSAPSQAAVTMLARRW